MKKKLVVIRGAGELATGIAHRLHNFPPRCSDSRRTCASESQGV